MEPKDKNSAIINDLKNTRAKLEEITNHISNSHNSDEGREVVRSLKQADHYIVDRLVSLGCTVKVD